MKGAGLRSRWPRWPITLAVIGVIVAGGAAAVAKWPHAWWWVVIIAAVVAAMVLPALAQVAQRWQDIEGIMRAGFKGTTGPGGRKLPTVSAARLETRAHRAVDAIPYIRRDEEEAIGAHLRDGRPVLLIGPSMVGKTRMAAQVINDEYRDWPAAIPDAKTGLAELDAKGIKLRRCVIWLDDIERLIGEGGLTEGALQRLAAAGNVIIGTIRTNEYERFLPSDQSHLPEWDVLRVFKHVSINRELTPGEQERLEEAVTDPSVRDRIRRAGLGEYAGAAWQVAEELELGAGAHSVGYALVLAAADWRRCGMTRPLSVALLPQLAGPRLDQGGRARLSDQAAFNAGLAWASRDINPSVSLLQLVGPDAYDVYDYALDLITQRGAPVPDDSWALVITNADPYELLRIGYTAEFTYHRVEAALRAWRVAANSGHTDVAPRAAFSLGNLLREQGDADGAKAAYQQAIDSGHPDTAPGASNNLGHLLADQGDGAGAKAAYQQAIDSGHPDAAPMAAGGLGLLLQQQGDADGAKAAYSRPSTPGTPSRHWRPSPA